MPRLECIYSLERLEEGVLDKIVGIRQVTGPPGQSAAGETLQRSQVPCEEALDRRGVALARPSEKVCGCFD